MSWDVALKIEGRLEGAILEVGDTEYLGNGGNVSGGGVDGERRSPNFLPFAMDNFPLAQMPRCK